MTALYEIVRVNGGEVKNLLTDCYVDAKGYIRVYSGTSGIPTWIETQYQKVVFDPATQRIYTSWLPHYDYFYHVPSREAWEKILTAFGHP